MIQRNPKDLILLFISSSQSRPHTTQQAISGSVFLKGHVCGLLPSEPNRTENKSFSRPPNAREWPYICDKTKVLAVEGVDH